MYLVYCLMTQTIQIPLVLGSFSIYVCIYRYIGVYVPGALSHGTDYTNHPRPWILWHICMYIYM